MKKILYCQDTNLTCWFQADGRAAHGLGRAKPQTPVKGESSSERFT